MHSMIKSHRELMERRMDEGLEKLYATMRQLICRAIIPGIVIPGEVFNSNDQSQD